MKREMHINLDVTAASFSRSTARTAEHSAENISEVFESRALKSGKIKTRTIKSTATVSTARRAVERSRTKLVILRTLFLIGKYLIRFIDFFELRFIATLFVWVIFVRQTTKCFFNFVLRSGFFDPEKFVVVFGHILFVSSRAKPRDLAFITFYFIPRVYREVVVSELSRSLSRSVARLLCNPQNAYQGNL